jgi:hypothetical protein
MRAIGAVPVSLAVLALTACSSAPPPPPVGVVADSGFRPPANGFTFQNYGATLSGGAVPTNLTPAAMQSLFGNAVCADAAAGKCDLIPEAQAWMDDMNQGMGGGHCFGFSVAADIAWHDQVSTATYGAPTINRLTIDNNASLQSTIARAWVYQVLDSVNAKKITGPPNQLLGELEKVLTPHASETFTITIFKRDGSGGHAVTPYEVDYKGGGTYDVLIYDNNLPGKARSIVFDTNTNTWSYNAATNPNNPTELYEGDAKTKTLTLFPTSPGQGTQPCPFCGTVPSQGSKAGTAGAAPTAAIYLTGSVTDHSHVLVTDHAGHRLGYVHGKLVNEIPGSHYVLLAFDQDWDNEPEPVLYVPANVAYTITLDGAPLTAPDTESIGIIGPSWDIAVNSIPMHPGETDTLTVDPNATRLTYRTDRAQSPTIATAVSDTRAQYAFVIAGVPSRPGSTINLRIPAEGGSLVINNVGSTAASRVDLQMTRSTEQGVQHFVHDGIPLVGADTADLQFGNWTGPNQGIPLLTTHNGQESSQVLTNQE